MLVRRAIRRFLGAALALGLALTTTATQADARDVKRCGITIGARNTGTLVGDVTCGYRCRSNPTVRCIRPAEGDDYQCPLEDIGCTPEQIVLEAGATLDLNGFDLQAAVREDTVVCSPGTRSSCTIKGPGTFYAAKGQAITPNGRDVVLENLTIDRDYHGFQTAGWVRATNVVLQNCSAAMYGQKGVRAKSVRVGEGCGLFSGKNLYLDDVEVYDSVGADGTVRGKDVVVRDGQLFGQQVFVTRGRLPLNVESPGEVFVPDLVADTRVVLRDSAAGSIRSGLRPRLIRSSCVASESTQTGADWDVCAED